MNSKIQRLIDWADKEGINLTHASLDPHFNLVTFWQPREPRSNFQAVKLAIGTFEKKGDPPYIKLEKQVVFEYIVNGENFLDDWRFKWDGAYECKSLGYDCGPATFAVEPEPAPDPEEAAVDQMADNAVEDWQTDIQP